VPAWKIIKPISFIVILNLVAVAALGLIIGAMKVAGNMALVVVPVRGVFMLCGFPWSDFEALNGLTVDESERSATPIWFTESFVSSSYERLLI